MQAPVSVAPASECAFVDWKCLRSTLLPRVLQRMHRGRDHLDLELGIMSRSPSWVLIQHRFYSVSFRKIIYKTEKPNLWDAPHFEHSVSLQNNESGSYKSDVLSTHLASTSRSGWCRFELESQPPRDTFLTACLHREQISFFSAFSFFAHSVSRRTKFSSS